MNFGQCFQGFLSARKISHAQAAALLGWVPANVTYYTHAKNPPRAHVLTHMALKLGVSEGELLGQAPAERPSSDPVVLLHKRIAELELENRDLKRQLAAIQKVLGKKP